MLPDEYLGERIERSHVAIAEFEAKVASGEYPTEDVPCFCGATGADKEVAANDRYGIPNRVVVCQECALIRINPRLTVDAYRQYYNNEYRRIHMDGWAKQLTSDDEEQQSLLKHQLTKGDNLIVKLAEQDIVLPQVVVDYGCHLGGMLTPFKKRGCETWGIEWDEASAATARAAGHQVVGSIEELVALGVKADLIIVNDVIEHLTDLHDMEKLAQLMHPESYIYLYTPGLFRIRFGGMTQVAHTYYFCANTLNWVLAEMGFKATYIDEECEAFLQYEGAVAPRSRKPAEWVGYVHDEIDGKEDRKLPPFSGICKFTKQELYANMIENFSHGYPDLYDITRTCSGSAIIIGGGPSVDDEIDTIKALQADGAKIIVISRMYPWCALHDIKPDYVVSLDCSEEQEKGFEKLQPGVTYLLSSVTRPSIVNKVAGEKIYIFDSRDDRKIAKLRRTAGYQACTVVNGGGSVSVLCLSLAFNLGFREIHAFGLDFMFKSPAYGHATGISGESVQLQVLSITVSGEEIQTTGAFLEFANQSLNLISAAHDQGILDKVQFHGDSLVNRLWDGKWNDIEEAVLV